MAVVERWPLVKVRLYLQGWSRSSTHSYRETNPASGQSGTRALWPLGSRTRRKYLFYVPNKVAIQCKCSGVYFSRRWRPLWSWIEYIGSVWNLRQPIDMISGSRVLSIRLCQRCFLKRAWKDITTRKKVFWGIRKETSESNQHRTCSLVHSPGEIPSYPR